MSGGRLTTHVLDTARGRPAAGLTLRLYRLDGTERRALCETATNADGRTDAPLLAGSAFEPGLYEIEFDAGAYLRAVASGGGDAPFLDIVPVRFRVADAGANWHVPLLLSPFGYSTYRGS